MARKFQEMRQQAVPIKNLCISQVAEVDLHLAIVLSAHFWKFKISFSLFPIIRVMHDEVSDTENIRKNLAIERMIVEGCDILLDTSQTFIRQGKTF